ncbi:hypothetical protein BDQ12DRAFT_674891 [Crucibulum laeve]|uniref:Ubiquitin-like domain-containing protein n=1 Tax=Crucibulum laeve TaxID=68775 RepID=A0A5C3MDB3_9AGAR|nr:hypothetical protein BDQ12DRAFT_674891 [Crucibulum laeve]
MSLVDLRIELPTHASSFVVQVPESCTVLDVKEEISRTCPGRPRVNGQKLIWRGRYLADQEKVEDLWKSQDEPRIVHLAVHPSAWVTPPPVAPQHTPASPIHPRTMLPTNTSRPAPVPVYHTQHRRPPLAPPASTTPHPLAYIVFLHQNALLALEGRSMRTTAGVEGLQDLRSAAIQLVENNGWSWPTILDDSYPEPTEGGLRYECVNVDAHWFLSLENSSEKPTPFQIHALHVLSYTFTLLSISSNPLSPPRPATSHTMPMPPNVPHVNEVLQQLGLNDMHLAPNQRRNAVLPELREIALRPLLAPMLMLMLRTMLLLYFVAPARKPIFGILILAWMLYEIWQPIRNGLRNLRRAAEQQPPRADAAAGGQEADAAPNAAQPAPRAGNGPAPGVLGVGRGDNQMAALIDTMGNMNMQVEDAIISQLPGAPTEEPGLGYKAMAFFGLLLTTLHPAVWNRRRAALHRREGTIRAEANIRDAPPREDVEGEEARQNEDRAQRIRNEFREQYARRPLWVRRYMERVVATDWVDDMD